MKIAILTFHRAYNCGAMLQAWALKTALERLGHAVLFPACNHVGAVSRWRFQPRCGYLGPTGLKVLAHDVVANLMSIGAEDANRANHRAFKHRFLPEIQCAAEELSSLFDMVVIGSDQVWNPYITKDDTALFLAETIEKGVPVVTYAASAGDKDLTASQLERIVCAARRCRAVSVREQMLVNTLQDGGIGNVALSLDPTLLLDGADFNVICCDDLTPNEPYVFLYAVNASRFILDTARLFAREAGVKLVVASPYQYSRFRAPKEILWGVSADRMVSLVRNARFVLGASFHGTALPLVLKVPFVSLVENRTGGIGRQESLLANIGLSRRCFCPGMDFEDVRPLLDYAEDLKCCPKLDELRARSWEYIRAFCNG